MFDSEVFLQSLANQFDVDISSMQMAQRESQQQAVRDLTLKQRLHQSEIRRNYDRNWKGKSRTQSKFLDREKNIASSGRENSNKAKAQKMLVDSLAGNNIGN